MMNSVTEVLGLRRAAVAESVRQTTARMRRNQEPAATAAEAERGSKAVSDSTVKQFLAEAWGWA